MDVRRFCSEESFQFLYWACDMFTRMVQHPSSTTGSCRAAVILVMDRLSNAIFLLANRAEREYMLSFMNSKSLSNALEALPKRLTVVSPRRHVRTAARPPVDRSMALRSGADLALAAAMMANAIGLESAAVYDALTRATEALAAERGSIDIRTYLMQTACYLAHHDDLRGAECRSLPRCVAVAADVFAVGAGACAGACAVSAAVLLSAAGENIDRSEGAVAIECAMRAATALISRSSTRRIVSSRAEKDQMAEAALRLLSMRSSHMRWNPGDREESACIIDMIKLLVGAPGTHGLSELILDAWTPTRAAEVKLMRMATSLWSLFHNLVFSYFHTSLPRDLRTGTCKVRGGHLRVPVAHRQTRGRQHVRVADPHAGKGQKGHRARQGRPQGADQSDPRGHHFTVPPASACGQRRRLRRPYHVAPQLSAELVSPRRRRRRAHHARSTLLQQSSLPEPVGLHRLRAQDAGVRLGRMPAEVLLEGVPDRRLEGRTQHVLPEPPGGGGGVLVDVMTTY